MTSPIITSYIKGFYAIQNTLCMTINNFLTNVGQSFRAKHSKRDKKNVTWTETADEFLTNVLIEQITLGRKDGIGFTSEGWREIERKMKEKFGDAYDKAKIRNRLRIVKSHYNHIKILIGLSGFGWDDITKRVTAEDQVWDDYLKLSE